MIQNQSALSRSGLLQSELQRIRCILAMEPSVRRMIAFGSVAGGPIHEWSDLDLAVIADTEKSFIERSLWLSRLVQPRVAVQFLVYTPEEITTLSRRPFVEVEILGKGKEVPMDPESEGKRWMMFAEEDLRMA